QQAAACCRKTPKEFFDSLEGAAARRHLFQHIRKKNKEQQFILWTNKMARGKLETYGARAGP
ncbi:MAG: hypothetical protein ACI3VP_05555, partial [Oscillospiraceae bacterium]